MPINISDVVVNIGQNSQTFDYYQLVNTIISLLVTLFAAFGGAYYGAKLTDDRKIIEEKQNNIDKTLFLYSFFNKYLSQLLDYDKDFITPKIIFSMIKRKTTYFKSYSKNSNYYFCYFYGITINIVIVVITNIIVITTNTIIIVFPLLLLL